MSVYLCLYVLMSIWVSIRIYGCRFFYTRLSNSQSPRHLDKFLPCDPFANPQKKKNV